MGPVFPAHAGMSRSLYRHWQSLTRFPRSRGDEPLTLFDDLPERVFSPLTRG